MSTHLYGKVVFCSINHVRFMFQIEMGNIGVARITTRIGLNINMPISILNEPINFLMG